MILDITRQYHGNCTVGTAIFGGFSCHTLELPWVNNTVKISCIPWGIYNCKKIISPSLGECFEINNVENRTFIRGHVGNYTSQIQGCILFGDSLVDFNDDGITDVTNSRKTFNKLMKLLPDEFLLRVSL